MQLTCAQNGGKRDTRMTASVKPDDLSLIRATWWERTDSHQLQETSSVRVGRGTRSCLYQPPEGPQTQAGSREVGGFPLAETDRPRKKVLEMMMFGDQLMR